MSCSARRLGAMVGAAVALAGCMTGRSSLLATRGGSLSAEAADGLTSSSMIGPSRALAVSGNAGARPAANVSLVTGSSMTASRAAAARSAALTGPTTISTGLRVSSSLVSAAVASNLLAPAPSAGRVRVAAGAGAHAGPVGASTRLGVAITPALAPASAVGASVAAVSQPLNVATSAQAGGGKGGRSPAKVAVKIKAPVIGASVHVGG